jgi:Ca2+-binding EF-hand superfamily protein
VSLEEHLEAHEALLSDKELFNQIVMRDSEGLLGLWDQDGDGKLSSQEYVKALWCCGVGEEAAREAFQHLDRDGSGYLTIEKILKALKEFYRSDDPEAPGNWLMGPY